jgi:transposase
MIGLPRGVEVFMYDAPCDMRRSFNTLSLVVQHEMKRDMLDGDLFLFVGKDRKRAKVLYFDGTGLCLFAKRLSSGQFPAPWKMSQKQLTLSELALFVEGASAVRQKLSPPVLRKVDLKMQHVETEDLCRRSEIASDEE